MIGTAAGSRAQIDQGLDDLAKFGPRHESLDVDVGLDRLAQFRVGINRFAQQYRDSNDITACEAIVIGSVVPGTAAMRTDQAREHPRGVEAGPRATGGGNRFGQVKRDLGGLIVGPELEVDPGQLEQVAARADRDSRPLFDRSRRPGADDRPRWRGAVLLPPACRPRPTPSLASPGPCRNNSGWRAIGNVRRPVFQSPRPTGRSAAPRPSHVWRPPENCPGWRGRSPGSDDPRGSATGAPPGSPGRRSHPSVCLRPQVL